MSHCPAGVAKQPFITDTQRIIDPAVGGEGSYGEERPAVLHDTAEATETLHDDIGWCCKAGGGSIEILPPENALQAGTDQLLYAACCVDSALHWNQEHC